MTGAASPAQFGPGEDFETYPRTLSTDVSQLVAEGCFLLWPEPV